MGITDFELFTACYSFKNILKQLWIQHIDGRNTIDGFGQGVLCFWLKITYFLRIFGFRVFWWKEGGHSNYLKPKVADGEAAGVIFCVFDLSGFRCNKQNPSVFSNNVLRKESCWLKPCWIKCSQSCRNCILSIEKNHDNLISLDIGPMRTPMPGRQPFSFSWIKF